MVRIEADVLIPGKGDTITNGCVILDGPTITYSGPVENAPKAPRGESTIGVRAVMPGMWECHGHFLGSRTANLEEMLHTPVATLAARATADAERGLMAGFTSVRELGGLGLDIARAIDDGYISGPHVYAAGGMLSPTGGHGDYHSFPLDFVAEVNERAGFGAICDGVPECLKATRTMLRRNARVLKLCASGGVASEVDHPVHQQFSSEELRAIVEEAARADRVVAAHCHGKPGMMAALEAGCRTIEHGTYLDDEAAELLVRKNALLVPTRFILDRLAKHAKSMGAPDYILRKIVPVVDQHMRAMKTAVRKGVRIAVGTDIITTGVTGHADWGMNGAELSHLTEAGMTASQAIEAATSNGPLTLGPQAPRSGQLHEGFDADVIALSADPTKDVRVLAEPANVRKIWKAGALVKDLSV